MKEVGKYFEIMMLKGVSRLFVSSRARQHRFTDFSQVDSYTPALYTRVLGYTMEETQVLMEHVKKEMVDKKIHKYGKYHFLIGQKPEA